MNHPTPHNFKSAHGCGSGHCTKSYMKYILALNTGVFSFKITVSIVLQDKV